MKFSDVMKKIRDVFEWFVVWCVCGWLYEVVWWMMIEENLGFINRGVLFCYLMKRQYTASARNTAKIIHDTIFLTTLFSRRFCNFSIFG